MNCSKYLFVCASRAFCSLYRRSRSFVSNTLARDPSCAFCGGVRDTIRSGWTGRTGFGGDDSSTFNFCCCNIGLRGVRSDFGFRTRFRPVGRALGVSLPRGCARLSAVAIRSDSLSELPECKTIQSGISAAVKAGDAGATWTFGCVGATGFTGFAGPAGFAG